MTRRQALQVLLIVSTLAVSWLGMMILHEAGHVLHAWLSGGTVQRVVLHPLKISQTEVRPNPNRLFVVWGGPLWGCVLPIAAWLVACRWWRRYHYLFAFVAGFCLIANGVYLGVAPWSPVGDALLMLRLGVPGWMPAAFGIATVPAGLWLWQGLGPHFGLGTERTVDPRAAAGMSIVLVVILLAEICIMSVQSTADHAVDGRTGEPQSASSSSMGSDFQPVRKLRLAGPGWPGLSEAPGFVLSGGSFRSPPATRRRLLQSLARTLRGHRRASRHGTAIPPGPAPRREPPTGSHCCNATPLDTGSSNR